MKVLFYANVQDFTSGEKMIETGDVQCMRALITLLGERFGEKFRVFLLGDNTCFFLINGRGIMATGGLDSPLHPDDKIEVLPFVGGG